MGGDGTIHEVVSGLVAAGGRANLAFIPAGTGNDFAKMFDVPGTVEETLKLIIATGPRRIDYGRLTWDGPDGSGSELFVNVAGVGIDAKVAAAAAGFKLLRGTPRYVAAVPHSLWTWQSPVSRIDLYGSGRKVAALEEQVLLALVANGRCAAGGLYLYLTPNASIVDGRLDACVVRSAPMGRILSLLARVWKGARHENEPEVTLRPVDAVEMSSTVPVPVQADGEVLTQRATSIRFDVAAGGLTVVLPVKT